MHQNSENFGYLVLAIIYAVNYAVTEKTIIYFKNNQ